MKGLLLKDWFILWNQCKYMLFIPVVFITVSVLNPGNEGLIFFLMSGVILAMFPLTIMGFDERSKWDNYAMTMPYSRTQLVLSKYCLTLFGMAVGCALYFIISLVVGFMGWGHVFSWEQTIYLLGILIFGILFYSGLTYPLIFKFGVEKGRIWFFATTILVSAGAGFLYSFSRKWGLQLDFSPVWFLVLAVILFIASAFLSVHFYKRREF